MNMRLIVCILLGLTISFSGCSNRTSRVRESDALPRARKVQYLGGTGASREEAIVVVGPKNHREGVAAEYDFLSELLGKKGKKWQVMAQNISREDGKIYDILEIKITKTGTVHYYYFDITQCSFSGAN